MFEFFRREQCMPWKLTTYDQQDVKTRPGLSSSMSFRLTAASSRKRPSIADTDAPLTKLLLCKDQTQEEESRSVRVFVC